MVMGDDSCLKGRGFESRRRILDGHFFTFICCKNCNVCLKKTKNKQKRGRGWPNLKKKKQFLVLKQRLLEMEPKAKAIFRQNYAPKL